MAKELINYQTKPITAPWDKFFPGETLPDGNYNHSLYLGEINLDDGYVRHIITRDFPPSDPWSKFFRSKIEALKQEGWFSTQPVMELGIGDGRNIRTIGRGIPYLIGVDIMPEKLDAFQANLDDEIFTNGGQYIIDGRELFNMRAEDFLALWNTTERGKFSGRVLMCLPQSPKSLSAILQKDTAADVYREPAVRHILHVLFSRWEKYGLTLNATVLERLRKIVADDTEVLMILSDRIMPSIKEQMIAETGWKILEKEAARVKQDWDTKLKWMRKLPDDGQRFFDSNGIPLPTPVAIDRINKAHSPEELGVYHDVVVYKLKPKSPSDI